MPSPFVSRCPCPPMPSPFVCHSHALPLCFPGFCSPSFVSRALPHLFPIPAPSPFVSPGFVSHGLSLFPITHALPWARLVCCCDVHEMVVYRYLFWTQTTLHRQFMIPFPNLESPLELHIPLREKPSRTAHIPPRDRPCTKVSSRAASWARINLTQKGLQGCHHKERTRTGTRTESLHPNRLVSGTWHSSRRDAPGPWQRISGPTSHPAMRQGWAW